jgi:hypothetical protein
VPFSASCASLLLVAATARRVLGWRGAAWAVLLLACSDRLLWHSCEAKPYACDVLAAALLAFLHCRDLALTPRLLLLAALAPLVICLCFPGCFLFGGVLLALLPAVWRSRRPGPWLSYVVLAAAVFAFFALLAFGPARAQRCGAMEQCWQHMFADWRRPWRVPAWALFSSLEVVRYCCGAAGPVLAGLAVLGAVRLWRGGRRSLVILLVVPIALALVAACARAYPYGGARVIAYAAPAVMLLVGAGAEAALSWLRTRHRLAPLGLAAVLLVPVPVALYRAARPWHRPACDVACAHVLARLQPGDTIASNNWVFIYYFRHQGLAARCPSAGRDGGSLVPLPGKARYRLDPDGLDLPSRRVWIVCTDSSAQWRHELARCMAPRDGRVQGQWEFQDTTVLLVQRASSAETTGLGHRGLASNPSGRLQCPK